MSRTRQETCWARRAHPIRGRTWRSCNLRKLGPMLVATVVFAAAIGLTACGGSDSTNQQSSGSKTPSVASTTAASTTVTSTTTAASTTPPAHCPNPDGGECLGKLAPGTYKTFTFRPNITYRVPAGWANFEDYPGGFLLLPPGGTLSGVNAGTSDFVGVYSSVAAPNGGCRPGTAPHVGRSVSDLAAWMTAHPGLTTTKPRLVSLGRFKGVVLDIRMKKGWTKTCPYSHGRPTVPLIHGVHFARGLDHNMDPGTAIRLYLLKELNRALAIEVDDLSGGKHLATYSQVAEAMTFGPPCPSSYDYDACHQASLP